MAKIDEFILNPSTEKLSETSQSIKDCLENINFKKLAEYPEYENDLTTLAERVIAFWSAAGTSSNVLSDNQTITLELAAKASYGLDACIKWDKANSIFKKNDWQVLRPAICQLMRKLINNIDKNNLIVVNHKNDTGKLLSLLAWIGAGIQYRVPDFGSPNAPKDGSEDIALLYGFINKDGHPSLIEITNNLVKCLLNAPVANFDTRQICKMAMRLGRMISSDLLAILESSNKPWIESAELTKALEKFFLSNLLDQYKDAGHIYPSNFFDAIAADNLCESLLIFFSAGVLSWESKSHRLIAQKAATSIKKVSAGTQTDSNFVKRSTAFLTEAIKNVPEELADVFNQAFATLKN